MGFIGSGSTYVYGYCDATYKDGMSKEETIEFVKNSESTLLQVVDHPLTVFESFGTRNVQGRFIGRCHPYVCDHRRGR